MKRNYRLNVAMACVALCITGTMAYGDTYPDGAPPAKAPIPWTTAAQAGDYALVGTELWNLETNTLVSKDWTTKYWVSGQPRLVADRRDFVFAVGRPSAFGFASTANVTVPGTDFVADPQVADYVRSP